MFVFLAYLLVFFTQILSGRAHWMQNLILHPTSTHTVYFWRTLLPQKQEIPGKCDHDVIIMFFQVFLFFGVVGSIKSIPSGYSLHAEFNSASRELSRLKFEYKHREICQKYEQKSGFFMIPIPKFILKNCLIPIWYFKFKSISLANTWWHGIWIMVKRPILSWNFL